MKTCYRVSAAVAAALLLSACGGGGGGPRPEPTPDPPAPPAPPAPPPAPTPPPPPAPTPPPPAPPPPPQTNTSLVDLQHSESFTNDAASGTATFPRNGNNGTNSAGASTLSVAYDASSRSYTISVAGRSQAFSPADVDSASSSAALQVYRRTSGTTTDTLSLTRPGTSGRYNYTYVGGGFWQRTIEGQSAISGSFDAFAYGVETPDGALPRSGAGVYLIDLLGVLATPGDLYALGGFGRLDVDFAGASIRTSGTLETTNTTTGFRSSTDFSGTGSISSSANAFNGTLSALSPVGALSGPLVGRFYGPQAQEVGAAFALTNTMRDSSAVGTIIGRSSSTGAPRLDALTGPVALPTQGSVLTYTRFTEDSHLPNYIDAAGGSGYPNNEVRIDPGAGTYAFRDGFMVGGALVSAPIFAPGDRVAAESNGRFTVYRRTTGDAGRQTVATLRLYRPGAGNDELVLTYASFGELHIEDRYAGMTRAQNQSYWFAYGLPTEPANIPRVGQAQYQGVLYGSGAGGGVLYALTGTATFGFNLGTGSFSGSLNPIATNRTTGAVYTLTPLTVNNGMIDFNVGVFEGALSPSNPVGWVRGRFYGPNGQEIGGSFMATVPNPVNPSADLPITGAVAATRR